MNLFSASSGTRLASRRGFSFIEVVVVMSLLTSVLLMIAATLWGAVKIEHADSATLHRMIVQAALADQFREDVGQAEKCLEALREFRDEPTCLILKVADERYVVYRWADQRLKRTEFAGDQMTTVPFALGGDRIDVRFERTGDGRLVKLHLVESRGRGNSRRDWPLEFSAALGGDRR